MVYVTYTKTGQQSAAIAVGGLGGRLVLEAQNLASAASVRTRVECQSERVVEDEKRGADGEDECCDDG
jgi:hypothetical protein